MRACGGCGHAATRALVDEHGRTDNLNDLLRLLKSRPACASRPFRENMTWKVQKYEELLQSANASVEKALEAVNLKVPELKRVARLDKESKGDNWHIFDSVSGPYRSAKDLASYFEVLLNRSRDRLSGTMAHPHVTEPRDPLVEGLRDDLVHALERLSNHASQAHIVVKVVDMVSAFLKDPRLFRSRMMNFMLMGGAGTGKTTIAAVIGDVFARAGMFVGNRLIEAGRADLVGQYMGETVTKTRDFLLGNLDNGVIFIDEAYAITPWEEGKPEGYGSEAATAMVEFMSRFQGLYCIIVAGYEREMVRFFLPTNEGLNRRFPHKFLLADMSADEMVRVFKRQVLFAQGLEVPHGTSSPLQSDAYFSQSAYAYLRNLIKECMMGETIYADEVDPRSRKRYENTRQFRPRWPFMTAC